MKKSIIKRRKRVVPATQEQSPNSSHLASFSVSISPDPQHSENRDLRNDQQDPPNTIPNDSMNLDLRLRNQEVDHPIPWEPAPIGVDFTGYQIDQQRRLSSHQQQQQQQHLPLPSSHDPPTAVSPSESQPTLSPFPSSNSRKRSFSISERDNPSPPLPETMRSNRLNSISSLLNPPQQQQPLVDDMPIDPSLSSIGQQNTRHMQLPQPQPYQHPRPPDMRSMSVGNGETNDWAAQRKAQLRFEAEEMREMLRAKERELQELDGEG